MTRRNQTNMELTSSLDMPRQICPTFEFGTLSAFFGESEAIQTDLVHSDEELIRKLVSLLDNQLLAVLETRSVLEFVESRRETFPRYVRARRALSDTMSNLASESELEKISRLCSVTLTEDLRKLRPRLGDKLTDQAVFTLWTLGKVSALAQKVNKAGDPRDKDADLKLNSEYHSCLLWTQFHLDVLAAAMKFKKAVRDDVQGIICDGLRTAVNLYAILKEAFQLRTAQAEFSPPPALPWDEEDEQLLAASMKDVNADFSEGH